MNADTLVSIAIGSAFIAVALTVSLVKEDLNPRAAVIVRAILSLGAGFVAYGIVGNIVIEGPLMGLTVKAGGPIAITVLFYLFDPPSRIRTYVTTTND